MKKIIFFTSFLLLIVTFANAQHKPSPIDKKFSLAFSAGPSFPISNFGSKDVNNPDAGFAKTGFNLNLHFDYSIMENFGVASRIMYSKYAFDNSPFEQTSLAADHWQYYGIVAGPSLNYPINDKVRVDLKLLFGVTSVNSPAFSYGGSNIVKEDWSTTFATVLGAEFRYNVAKDMFLLGNVDFSAMRPTLHITNSEGTNIGTGKQKMGIVNLTVGAGVSF